MPMNTYEEKLERQLHNDLSNSRDYRCQIRIDIPRIRDFRGLSDRSFDGRGNYTLGVKEQIIFPEIDYDKIDRVRGMDITMVTSAQSDEEAYELLAAFGMPFKKRNESQG